jgi:hypothetical protein
VRLFRRPAAPSYRELITPAAEERADASVLAALAVHALFGGEPADRALKGWFPGDSLAYAEVELRQWAAAGGGT